MEVWKPEERLLAYSDRLEKRTVNEIDRVVVHCTELPDLAMAREYGNQIHHSRSQTGNSGHFYINRDGHIEVWVPADRIAHHVRNFNARSIGIELVNLGRYPDWLDSRRQEMTEPYPSAQIESLIKLLQRLHESIPSLKWISGHEDLDNDMVPASDKPDIQVARKKDPGPMFPWDRVLQAVPLVRST
jgi:N-acetylmuramoyl-L-alanine amidase